MMTKKKTITDPLQAAQVSAPKGFKKPISMPKPTAKVTVVEKLIVEALPPVAAPAPVKPLEGAYSKYKIANTKTVSTSGGGMTTMKQGSIISAHHFGGVPGIARLRDAGLILELVE